MNPLKKELELRLEERAILNARESMLAFTKYTMPSYRVNWHHRLLCSYLDRFVAGEIRNLMVFMPPRHGKSELVSRRLPAYLLGKKPGIQIIATSYSADLSGMMNRDVQRIIDDEKYGKIFPETQLPDGRGSGRVRNTEAFETANGGFYKSAGVGGGITGMGANYAIIDDPIKNQEEANSETVRENIWGWYTSTLYTRLQAPRSLLITLTRWSFDDIAGRLLDLAKQEPKADQWTVLKLPARCEFYDRHPDDPRQEGEALWEEDFGDKTLTAIKASVGPIVWSALYQQSPSPAAGGFFEARMFEFKALPEKFNYTFITGDTAYKESQENDYTVMSAWGWDGANLWLIDVYRQRIKAADSETPIIAFIANNTKWGFRGAYIEPKGHGIYLNQALPKRGVMMPSEEKIKEFFNDRRLDKKERASNAVPNLSNKQVFINEQIHIKEELLAEVLAFPKGKHDDFCFVGETLIATTRGDIPIKDLRPFDKVLTPFGPRRILAWEQTGVKPVITKCGLTGTPDHPVFQHGIGFSALDTSVDALNDSLSWNSLIRWTVRKQLSLMGPRFDEWAGRDSIISASRKVMQDEGALRVCMWQFGSMCMAAQFPKAFTFITEMVTRSIIMLIIWSSYRAANTRRCLKISICKIRDSILRKLDRCLPRGIDQMRGALGIEKTLRHAGVRSSISDWSVRFAQSIFGTSNQTPCTAPSHASIEARHSFLNTNSLEIARCVIGNSQPQAKQLSIVDRKLAPEGAAESFGIPGAVPVYNLTVEGSGCYYANGMLVSNCDTLVDALKMVYPSTPPGSLAAMMQGRR